MAAVIVASALMGLALILYSLAMTKYRPIPSSVTPTARWLKTAAWVSLAASAVAFIVAATTTH